MRPSLAELLAGIHRTILSNSMPIVQKSGEMESLWEIATSTRLLAFIETRWKDEFGRLARENLAMVNLLFDAVPALKALDHPAAGELAQLLERPGCEINALPPIETLEQQNLDLKEGLDRFIRLHAAMPGGGTPALQAVRARIREFLKEITQRDFPAAQKVILL